MFAVNHRRSTGSIITVLLLAVLGLTLIFVIATSAVTGLTLQARRSNADQARNAAESVVQAAIAKLIGDRRHGAEGQPSPGLLTITSGDAVGELTFQPLEGDDTLPASLNNIEGDTPREGWQRLIPPQTVQLVGRGRCNGVDRIVEAVVNVPHFPYVVATSGRFAIEGPLEVGVLPRGTDPAQPNLEEVLPGDLVSNATGTSVSLNPAVTIHGNVKAVGSIESGNARILGERQAGGQPEPLPDLDLGSYDPISRGVSYDSLPATLGPPGDPAVLAGWNRRQGDLHVNGDLQLEAGILFVDGNVTIQGGLIGRGAVIASGSSPRSIRVTRQSNFESDHQVALLADGDIELGSESSGSGSFRGLVYTEGDFTSRAVAVVGAVITNGASGNVSLNGARAMISDPTLSFERSWLTMTRYEIPLGDLGTYINPTAVWDQDSTPRIFAESRYLGENEEGLWVVEWTYTAEFPDGNSKMEVNAGTGRVRFYDYYDPTTGQRVDFETVSPPTGYTGGVSGLNRRAFEHIGNFPFRFEVEGVTQGAGRPPGEPNDLAVVRVREYESTVDFSLDFSQFLQPEDRMKMLLWVEHS
jgi:hypothetical protein